jgi:hypothetical protein
MAKKKKLFDGKDIKKMQLPVDMQSGLQLNEETRDHVFASMLPRDTQFLQGLKDELELFGERLYREIIRTL